MPHWGLLTGYLVLWKPEPWLSTENRAVATAVVKNGARQCKTVKYRKPRTPEGVLSSACNWEVSVQAWGVFFQVRLTQHRLAVKLYWSFMRNSYLPGSYKALSWKGSFKPPPLGRGCFCLLLETGWRISHTTTHDSSISAQSWLISPGTDSLLAKGAQLQTSTSYG